MNRILIPLFLALSLGALAPAQAADGPVHTLVLVRHGNYAPDPSVDENIGPHLSPIGVAQAHPRVLADPGPGVLLTDFADSSIMLELGFWVGDPELGTGGVRSDINLEILRVFRREGIAIPFPQREVRVLSDAQGTICSNRGTSSEVSA